MPAYLASFVRCSFQMPLLSRRTIDFIAALASGVVAATPIDLPFNSFFSKAMVSTKEKTCSINSLGSRCRMMVRLEWSGVDSVGFSPRKLRSDRLSLQRQAMPRCESMPSN